MFWPVSLDQCAVRPRLLRTELNSSSKPPALQTHTYPIHTHTHVSLGSKKVYEHREDVGLRSLPCSCPAPHPLFTSFSPSLLLSSLCRKVCTCSIYSGINHSLVIQMRTSTTQAYITDCDRSTRLDIYLAQTRTHTQKKTQEHRHTCFKMWLLHQQEQPNNLAQKG